MKTTIEIKDEFVFSTRCCMVCGEDFYTEENSNRISICENGNESIDGVICNNCTTNGIENIRVCLHNKAKSLRVHADVGACFLEAMAAGEICLPEPEDAKATIKKINQDAQKMWCEHEEQYGPLSIPHIF